MAKLAAKSVRKTLNKLIAQANKQIKTFRRTKNAKQLRQLSNALYDIRDAVDNTVGVFEELSSDAGMAADEVEDSEND